jgi:multiple sugar transport system permease protein
MSATAVASQRHDSGIQRFVAYTIVAACALIMMGPFYFMFVFATHTNSEILSIPPPLWFGNAFIDNFKELLNRLPHFWDNVGWSVYIALMSTVLNLFFCSLAGFAFAVYDFRGRNALFAAVMATMLLPSFIGMIPTALTMTWLDWMDQPRALYVPGAVAALGIFMMRQYIESAIPHELIDAARIDGCSEFSIYWRIVLPLIGPALGTLGLITFIGSWNNFIGPLIVIRDPEMFTVPLALRSLQATGQVPWGVISAGAAIAVLPLLALFMLTSRQLIEGLTGGAVKS